MRRPSHGTVVAYVSLFVALGGTSVAAVTIAKDAVVSRSIKDGQVKNLGRGQYVRPDNLQNGADNADILTNDDGNVSLSGLSGHFRKEEPHVPANGNADLFINERGEAEF